MVRTAHPPAHPPAHILERICGEFLEMPGLRLTQGQAQRLWGLDDRTCTDVLRTLKNEGFLQQMGDGSYGRSSDGPAKRSA